MTTSAERNAYIEWGATRAESRFKVAVAWVRGLPASGSNFRTDGDKLWSYDHVVGITTVDGFKIAHDCRYSVTTRKQIGPAMAMADRVERCPGKHPERNGHENA